jgi:hypothetical protein
MHNKNYNLTKVMRDFPYLCDWGFASKGLLKLYGYELADQRKYLKDSVKEFELCCDWLTNCQPIKAANYKILGSYGLKDLVEKWAGQHISNGAFIAAVLSFGLPYKAYDDSVNIHIGISSRSPMLKA